jgi:hypothetical protein
MERPLPPGNFRFVGRRAPAVGSLAGPTAPREDGVKTYARVDLITVCDPTASAVRPDE